MKPHFCFGGFRESKKYLPLPPNDPAVASTMGQLSRYVKRCRSISIRKHLEKGNPSSWSIPLLGITFDDALDVR
jgi:hypothetical protein